MGSSAVHLRRTAGNRTFEAQQIELNPSRRGHGVASGRRNKAVRIMDLDRLQAMRAQPPFR